MKYFAGVISIIILGAILQSFFPFWTLAIAGFIVAMFIGGKGRTTFFYGFIAGILLWGGYAFFIDLNNEGILSSQIGQLFSGIGRPVILLFTAIIGGLLAGLGAMTGSFAYQFFNDSNTSKPPHPDDGIEYSDFKKLRPEWKDKDFI